MMFNFFVALAVIGVSSAAVYTENAVEQKALWEGFKANFNKVYSTMSEESRRFSIFLENLQVIDHRNGLELRHGGNEVHGITKFSDLSQAEFETRYLTADASLKTNSNAEELFVTRPVDATAGLIDWAGKLTTAVKDQGYCGSCWAFSATEQIESEAIRTLSTTYILSPEQITQCDTTSYGCNGGWTENAYNYVKKAGGITTDALYPYTSYQGTTGTCKTFTAKIKVSGYTKIAGSTTTAKESSMASHVQTTGPLSVCIDATTWNSYKSGIMSVCGTSVDHCVQAVGVDATTNTGYWKVRNSWATSWGESGYIRLKYGTNTCAITNDPTFPTVTKA
jgi:C1A family cysteine protease